MRLALHRTQGTVFRDPHRFKVMVAGRRWGKTRLNAAILLSRAKIPGLHRYHTPIHDQARDSVWPELKRFIPPAWLMKPPNETRLEIVLRSGATIQLKSADDPDKLRGVGLQTAILDEFQDMDPATWTEAVKPALLDTGGHAVLSGTPKSFNHLYDAYQWGQSPDPLWADWASWQYRSMDAAAPHGHLDPLMIEQERATTDPRTFRQEYEASFESVGGLAYYAFSRRDHVAQVTLDPDLPVCVSCDFNVDPSVAVIGQRAGDSISVWREVKTRHAGGEATRATGRAVLQRLREASFHGPIRVYGDATGRGGKTTGPADHAVLRELFGPARWCIPRANPHVRDRVGAVNTRCQTMTGARHLTVDPSCVGLIADLEQVIFAANGDLDKRSNLELTHLSDALGYWLAYDFPVRTGALVSLVQADRSAGSGASLALQALRRHKAAAAQRG